MLFLRQGFKFCFYRNLLGRKYTGPINIQIFLHPVGFVVLVLILCVCVKCKLPTFIGLTLQRDAIERLTMKNRVQKLPFIMTNNSIRIANG